MALQEITHQPLPLVMRLVGDDALEEGKSYEEAFAVAHAALVSLQAARLQGKLEIWPARSMANLTEGLPGFWFLSDVCVVTMFVLGPLLLLGEVRHIPFHSSLAWVFLALVWPVGILTQGAYARTAERWLGQSDHRASYLERFFLLIPGIPYFERHYLVQHEDLVDQINVAIEGGVVDEAAFESNSTHLPHPLREKIFQAIKSRDVCELTRIRNQVLRPSDIVAAANLGISRLRTEFDSKPPYLRGDEHAFCLLDWSNEIERGIKYYSAL